ncbi:MAG: aspartyl protease family protein [Balneola sp.]
MIYLLGIGMLSLLLISSCNYTKNVILLSRGSVQQTNFLESIDFENRHGLIVVKGFVNGNDDTLEFLFDTGAFDGKITRFWGDKYNLKEKATKNKSDSQGNENEISMTLIKELSLGTINFKNTAAGIIDFPQNSLSPCIAADGIIGANLIREANWKIDFVNNKIWITDDFSRFNELNTREVQAIKFKKPLLSGTPTIDVTVNQRALGNILFDTGSNGSVDLPRSIKDQLFATIETEWDTTLDNSSSGIWGTNFDSVFATQSAINFEGYNSISAEINFAEKGFAKVGNDVLEKYDVYLNYDKKRIYLNPNPQFQSTETKQNFGFIPYYQSENYWTVENLRLGSPADNSGINFGDIITKIDGKTPEQFYSTFCGYFDWVTTYFDDKKSVKIELQNSAITIEK